MPTTLETAISKYLRSGNPAARTREEYATTLRKWEEWNGGVPIDRTSFHFKPEPSRESQFPRALMIRVMEATGGCEALLVKLLHEQQIAHAVVNPGQERDFAKGLG